jgi:hypothetical protein
MVIYLAMLLVLRHCCDATAGYKLALTKTTWTINTLLNLFDE